MIVLAMPSPTLSPPTAAGAITGYPRNIVSRACPLGRVLFFVKVASPLERPSTTFTLADPARHDCSDCY